MVKRNRVSECLGDAERSLSPAGQPASILADVRQIVGVAAILRKSAILGAIRKKREYTATTTMTHIFPNASI